MICVTGSLSFDNIMNLPGKFADFILPDKIHTLNVSFMVKTLRKERGGCGANVAYNLSFFRDDVCLLTAIGQDGKKYKKWLEKKGIDLSYSRIFKNELTATGFAIVDKLDNQLWGYYRGALKKATLLSLKKIKEKIDFLYIGPNDPKVVPKFAFEAKKLKIPYAFDPAFQIPQISKNKLFSSIKGAQILFGNDYEIALICKKLNLKKVKLLKLVKILVTTLGEKGSMVESGDKKISIRVAQVKEVADPVGAGDAYRAGFLAGYLEGKDLKTCGRIGSVCAVYTVEKYGTTTHHFSKKEFVKRYKKNYNSDLTL